MNPGIYRRCIITTATGTEVRADLEDDLHRYAVIVRHDGAAVTAVRGLPLRVPWSLCPQSAQALDRLVGMPLSPHPLAVFRHTDGTQQCTHMFDLAGLAVAHAARGIARRRYDIEAPYFRATGPRTLSLRRDGADILHWTIDGITLLAPKPFAGRDVRRLPAWADATLSDPDMIEAIALLRRAVLISKARLHDWDIFPTAADTGHGTGACYVFQPGVQEQAVRMRGTARDFTHAPERMLPDLEE